MEPPEEPEDSHAERLALIDEILQVMYWLRGERLASAVTPGDLARWVGLGAGEITPLLERMSASGFVQPAGDSAGGPPRYALTEAGAREGGRRFADEFAGLTRPRDGECADPHCEGQRPRGTAG